MEINSFKKNILDKKYGRRSFLIGGSQLILVGLLIRQIRQIQLNESAERLTEFILATGYKKEVLEKLK